MDHPHLKQVLLTWIHTHAIATSGPARRRGLWRTHRLVCLDKGGGAKNICVKKENIYIYIYCYVLTFIHIGLTRSLFKDRLCLLWLWFPRCTPCALFNMEPHMQVYILKFTHVYERVNCVQIHSLCVCFCFWWLFLWSLMSLMMAELVPSTQNNPSPS